MNLPATINQFTPYFNYVRKPDHKIALREASFEEIEEAMFYPVLDASKNLCPLCERRTRSKLPLVSDFGEINTPYELIYARLEGLQYAYST